MPLDFSSGRKPLAAFSLASLTDIVLLLLVFFLLTSSFVTQYALRVNLPNVATAAPAEQDYVAVTLQEDGRIFVDERETLEENLAATINTLRGERTALAVYADETVPISRLASVASAASALGMRVSIATDVAAEE